MKEKIVNSVTNFITKNKNCDDRQIKIIKYGLSGMYSLITKLAVVVVLVILTDTFIEFLTLLIAYILLRSFSFGLHASSSLLCWIVTIPIYVGGSLLVKFFLIPIYISYIIWIFAFVSFILWAPADTPKRPLIRAKQRKIQKIKTCIIAIIYLIILILVDNQVIINSITYALLIQTIMINPAVYWITKTPFNNYKFYPNKV